MSCPTTTFCVAVPSGGKAFIYNGATWSTGTTIDSPNALKAVSCPNPNFCVAVDNAGNAFTFNGSSWSGAANVDGTNIFSSISCPTSSTCVAVDKSGNQVTYNGGTWTAPTDIDGTATLDSISCSTTNQCATVDATGHTLTYTGTTNSSQLVWDHATSTALTLSDNTNDYIYGPIGTPVEQINLTTNTPTYLTYSPTNSTWISSNSSGDETGYWGYDAYGTLAFGTATSPFGYAGQYSDLTTGLSNMRARWYQPQTGGFTTRDPAFASTDTAYTYASGDPVNNSDPSGDATVGYCGTLSASFLGPAGFGSGCLTRTVAEKSDQIGVVGTYGGGGAQSLSLGASATVQVTNATSLGQLSGPFAYFLVSVGDVYGGTVIVFIGQASNNKGIFGLEAGGGYNFNFNGAVPGAPFTIGGGIEDTYVHKFSYFWTKYPAKGAWDAASEATGTVNAVAMLDFAQSLISQSSNPSQQATLLPCYTQGSGPPSVEVWA